MRRLAGFSRRATIRPTGWWAVVAVLLLGATSASQAAERPSGHPAATDEPPPCLTLACDEARELRGTEPGSRGLADEGSHPAPWAGDPRAPGAVGTPWAVRGIPAAPRVGAADTVDGWRGGPGERGGAAGSRELTLPGLLSEAGTVLALLEGIALAAGLRRPRV